MKAYRSFNKITRSSTVLGLISASALVLFFIRSSTAIDYMKKGLKLCSATVIPALFPFMVISELVVYSGLGRIIGKMISKPVKLLFGISESCACAFALGILCGFPIGAKTLCSLYDKGDISRQEIERAMIFCNNPGSAFVINAVGLSIFGNKRIGIMLYIVVILSSLILGISARIILGRVSENKKTPPFSVNVPEKAEGVSIFIRAITGSASSMLSVCALVVFFSALVGCIGSILSDIGADIGVIAALGAFFELSSGVSICAELKPHYAILLCSAALGWSGISVHLQIASICSGLDISLKPYIISKAFQSVICFILTALALKIFPLSNNAFLQASNTTAYSNATFLCVIFFLAAVLPIIPYAVKRLNQ